MFNDLKWYMQQNAAKQVREKVRKTEVVSKQIFKQKTEK